MQPSDLDLLRQRLEEQFRADVQLLYEGLCAKLRAADAIYLAQGPLDPARLLPALTFGVPGTPLPGLQPAPATAPAQLPPAPDPPPVPAAPRVEKRRRWSPNELRDEVLAALEQVGEVFDRLDLARLIGGLPGRSTLNRLLAELEHEGRLALAKPSEGRKPARYRNLSAGASGSLPAPER